MSRLSAPSLCVTSPCAALIGPPMAFRRKGHQCAVGVLGGSHWGDDSSRVMSHQSANPLWLSCGRRAYAHSSITFRPSEIYRVFRLIGSVGFRERSNPAFHKDPSCETEVLSCETLFHQTGPLCFHQEKSFFDHLELHLNPMFGSWGPEATIEKKERPHFEEGTKCSNYFKQTNHSNRPGSLLETKLGLNNSLPSDFSRHILLLHCHSPSTVREKVFLAVTAGLFGSGNPATRPNGFPGTTDPGRCGGSRPPSEVLNPPGKGNTFSPDCLCPITFRARLSTLCSRESDEGRPSLPDHDPPSLSQLGQPYLHMSPRSARLIIQLHLLLPKGANQSAHNP